ncbi:hypothetical protein GCM10007304_31800 [Rhodococcoides trifolii]|uniref:DUF4307 domain-containing protein n=1 Tax=Rhodococcoides trifolii TaxID=908250 RepID=A0A917LE05_9NOCA|nr:DUF4307 domain-containing protein [Rhodococcus trifolii]GGG15356.1 hypothetical protein GCM10007304_31800 [Rhodococcus trifolii]
MTTTTRPEGRYPTPSRFSASKALALVLGALVIALGVAVAYLGYQKFTTPDVDGDVVSFVLVDDARVDIRLSVSRADPSLPAVCIVRARSKDGTETGRREVLIPASTSNTVDVQTFVIASQPPALGDLYGCSLNVPGYLTGT